MIASGISAPAPTPWTARAAISMPIEVEAAPSTAPAMKTTSPMVKNSRRP